RSELNGGAAGYEPRRRSPHGYGPPAAHRGLFESGPDQPGRWPRTPAGPRSRAPAGPRRSEVRPRLGACRRPRQHTILGCPVPGAAFRRIARIGGRGSEHGEIAAQLVLGDLEAVLLPLRTLVAQEEVEDVLPQRVGDEL